MAFADPQSITISGTATSLPRVSSGVNAGSFASGDGTLKKSVAHSYGRSRTRRTIRVDLKKIAADPLLSGVNNQYSTSVYLVVDLPAVGFTNTELKNLITGFLSDLTASSGAQMDKLLGGEN